MYLHNTNKFKRRREQNKMNDEEENEVGKKQQNK
jgi:hypothetical protein